MAKKKQTPFKEAKKGVEKSYLLSKEDDTCLTHYDDANAELDVRINHEERGFNVYEKLYRNYINPGQWPFQARVPDGRPATIIDRKTDRLLANKLQGKFTPRKHGTDLGARIASELILHQWNKIDLYSSTTMLQRWRMMDSRCRRFGKSFGRVSWRRLYDAEGNVTFEGPWFDPWDNKDVLTQPGARSIEDSDWLILRDYVTPGQLKRVNDMAKTGPIYDPDVVDLLLTGDAKNVNYVSIDKQVIGLDGGSGNTHKVEVCTEYNQNTGKWKTFIPKQGTGGKNGYELRTIDNPFKKLPTIPVVEVSYYPIDDDMYGKPELENVTPLVKTAWALMSQNLEQTQNELYTPIMVNPQTAQLDTLKFKSGARWLMQRPGEDVVPFQSGNQAMQKFIDTYGLISSLILEGTGETGQDVSAQAQNFTDKTATEIKDNALLRTSKDNANKAILSQSISRMVDMWLKMDQEMMSKTEIVRIVGHEALDYFINEDLHNWTLTDDGARVVTEYLDENQEEITQMAKNMNKEPFEIAYEALRVQGVLDEYAEPMNPKTQEGEQVPQLRMDKDEREGYLTVDKKDIIGDYDYLVDIEAMSAPNDQAEVSARSLFFESTLKVKDDLAQQGITVKWKDILEKLGQTAHLKDTEKYFDEKPAVEQMQGQMPQVPGIPPITGLQGEAPQESPTPNMQPGGMQ
jgi:hypothetical protein